MTRKREAKKKRREKRKKNKDREKSGQALLLHKMRKSEEWRDAKIVVEPKGPEKMSEVIQDFAKPLLDECEDDESARKAIALSILVWNACLFPKKEQKGVIKEIYSDLSKSHDARDNAMMVNILDMLVERKKKYFADNKRAIVEHQFTGSGKNRRLDVVSTLVPY